MVEEVLKNYTYQELFVAIDNVISKRMGFALGKLFIKQFLKQGWVEQVFGKKN